MRRALRRWLEAAPTAVFSAYAIGAAFTAYFSMYGFRKPFSAGTYAQQEVYGLELKFALVIAQILGYTLSKFISIKVISELSPARRLVALLSLVGVAELALLGVAVLPMPLKPLAIFFNGLPLGAIWGLVFSFLEGRQTSEVLGAGLSMSYIVASGAVKTVGRWVLMAGVPELWMPFVTGLVFAPVFVLACVGLSCLPRPSPADRAARTERAPMGPAARLAFVRAYGPGLFVLVGLYVLLTAFRDFRDNFAYELWAALGYAEQPAMLTYSELPVAASVMFAVALIFLVRDNRRAFFVMHGIMIAGAALTLAAVLLLNDGLICGAAFMMLVGSGLAFIIADGQSIYQIPDSFVWLGRGDDFMGLPNAVFLMIILYTIAHIAMTKMRIGRYIYATGGNVTAARLSGVPVKKVLVIVYTCCGCLAGLGGVITASQLKSGSPTYGLMYELYVIAAVVVGGTSLAGGEGKILGTLIGAFIIAVIQNGMNLTGVESYTQKVVLGLVILGAVLLDRVKKLGWRAFRAA